MRQGNGTELLGPNDPRSATIGIIYVSPTDDRKSVLAAIITQEKLGRKQVAVVLPNQNKAFQRPVDFDDLKSMRRKLQTQIVFVAPGGPGPAEFARQRRFQVYSTLESYTKALQDEQQVNGASKKGWLFSGARQKPGNTANGTAKPLPAQPLPPASIVPQQQRQDATPANGHFAPSAAGAVAGGLASNFAANGHAVGTNETSAPMSPARQDDWDALPPITSAAPSINTASSNTIPPQAVPNAATTNHTEGSGGPAIIELSPRRGRITTKLPVAAPAIPVVLPDPPPVNKAPRRSGKMATAGAGVAGATLARTASGGGAPAIRGNAGGPGGGGAGGPGPRIGPRVIALVGLLLLTLLVCGGIAVSAPNTFLSPITRALPGIKTASPATVTITPDNKVVSNSYIISAVTGTPNASQRQVTARIVSSAPASQQKTVNATGVRQIPATRAAGSLTFYNLATYTQYIGKTVFTDSRGVQVENDATVPVPAGNPPTLGVATVSAHAVQTGAAGNIAAGDINQTCCVSGVSVKNTVAFTGGQDPQNYTVVQQSDIDNAAAPLRAPLLQQAQNDLKSQIHANEQLATPVQCTTSSTANQAAGDKASSVTVTVSATCKTEVYDQKAAQTLVTGLLQTQAQTNPGAGYALVGAVVTDTKVQSVSGGTVALLVTVKGRWVYQFTDAQKQALKQLIAGKTVDQAKTLLQSQKGVSASSPVDIQVNGNTLPTDIGQISIVVQNVPGFQGGGSPGGVNMTPTVTGPSPTTPTPQTGLGGS